jgi:release factor glutamine methyltransferase
MHWRTNKLVDLRNDYAEELYPLYGKEETDALLQLLIKRFFKLNRTDLVIDPDRRLSESEILRLHFAVKELKNHKPIQYILKHVEFLNTRIFVDESVLIPRPETEELVQRIIELEKDKEGLKILDIGTGSGCIAISLAKNLSNAKVTGIDVSAEALKTANKNAFVNEVTVDFREFNILDPGSAEDPDQFDLIVSNPPYVTQDDKKLMKENVLKHEPHLALFVPENDPLLFYKAILYFSDEGIKPGGRIYFEINELLGEEVLELLVRSGFENNALHKDVFGKNRFVSGVKRNFSA